MSREIIGRCALCGKKEKLTFEHIPPRGAFNEKKVKLIFGDTYIDALEKDSPPDLHELTYVEQQRGKGLYSLCSKCNNLTGSYYGQAYIDFAQNIADLMIRCGVKRGMTLYVEKAVIRPQQIIKQIASMFCSINQAGEMGDLREFVLDKNRTGLGDYRLGIYLFVGGIERSSPLVAMMNMGIGNPILFSEIVSFPIGAILVKGKDISFPFECLDISGFADCSYDDEISVEMDLPVYETNDMMPGVVIQ